jgi:hypothetical protein
MIILDTNVVSELNRPQPDHAVEAWLDIHPPSDLFLTAITAAELLYGVERLPRGKRQDAVAVAVAEILHLGFAGRVLPFDLDAAIEYSKLATHRERVGRRIEGPDAMIAAIALSAGDGILATRNTGDFEGIGLELVNPWEAQG